MTQTFLITGVSSGLGRAMARAALERGHVVVGTVRKQEDLEEYEQIAPGRSIGRLLDLTDTAAIAPVVAETEAEDGPIDVLINNAGYGLAGVIEELDLDDLRRQFEVGVIGQVAMTQAVLPGMRSRRRGHVVNIDSMGGVVTFAGNGAYHGAKFALLGISDTLAKEVEPFGIRVTSVLPGLYNTDWGGRSRSLSVNEIGDYNEVYEQGRQTVSLMTGDPTRLAEVVLDAISADEPPLRLLVGHSAVELVRETMARQSAEIDEWAKVSDTGGDG